MYSLMFILDAQDISDASVCHQKEMLRFASFSLVDCIVSYLNPGFIEMFLNL